MIIAITNKVNKLINDLLEAVFMWGAIAALVMFCVWAFAVNFWFGVFVTCGAWTFFE